MRDTVTPMPASTPSAYSTLAKSLHWIVALIVIVLVPVGFIMGDLPEGPIQDMTFMLHESFGLLILALMAVRVVRRASGTPAPSNTLAPWERRVSLVVHYSFYGLLIAMPLIGWFGTSAYGAGPSFFGLKLPALIAKDEHLSEQIFVFHTAGGIAIAVLFVLHVGGAAVHAFIKRDGVVQRMWFSRAA